MIVQLKDVCKDYMRGSVVVPVLHHIDFELDEGEYVAVMGPSGSGKSTLMNLIGCLDVPTSGTYLLEGRDISSLSENQLAEIRNKKIGFVFQRFHLLPYQNAVENVALPLLYAGVSVKERRARAREALEKVGLGDRLEFMPNQLSGGQCQRVAIARAIVSNPKLLLADEPTGALDTASGEQVMEIFETLNRDGVTVLMITHEPSIAACARRVLKIRDGVLHPMEGGAMDG
jgi:putative ABC transport system ATP-binding protein